MNNGGSRYSHLDRLGTNARTTDTSANLIDSRSYDAFGLPQQINNPSNSEQGFASAHRYQEDAESGLKLLGHRYYDPGSGRFITRDPIGSGMNWYRYTGNNPLRSVDPSGFDYTFVGGTDQERQDFLIALNNLAGTEEGDRIIWEILKNPKVNYKIRFHDEGNHMAGTGDRSEGDSIFKEMTIDTRDLTEEQYRTKDGKYSYYSWEHIIAHEAGHMIGGLGGPSQKPDGSMDYSQEQEAVDKWENSATRNLDQPARGKYEDHRRARRRPLPAPVRRPPPPPPGLE